MPQPNQNMAEMSWTTFPVAHSPRWMTLPPGTSQSPPLSGTTRVHLFWGCRQHSLSNRDLIQPQFDSTGGPYVAFGGGHEQREGVGQSRPMSRHMSGMAPPAGGRRAMNGGLGDTFSVTQFVGEPASVHGQISGAVQRADDLQATATPGWTADFMQQPGLPTTLGEDAIGKLTTFCIGPASSMGFDTNTLGDANEVRWSLGFSVDLMVRSGDCSGWRQ